MNYTIGADLFPSNTNQGSFGNWYTQDPRASTLQTIIASPTWSLTSNIETAADNALSTRTFGEDPEIFFTEQTSGEVFVSLFMEIDASLSSNLNSVNLDRLFEIAEASSSTSSAAACVFMRGKLDGSNNVIGVEFGINEDATATDASDVNWTGITHSEGEQLFLVFSYTKNSSTDTAAKLWINPVVNGTEPAVTVEDTTTNDKDPVRFSFNVRGSEYTPDLITDEFRIGNTWNAVAPVKGSTGSGAVATTITAATTPTFPVYESFDNYTTGAKLINDNTETGIGAWGTKDLKSPTIMEVVDAPTWGSLGTAIGTNNAGKALKFRRSGEDGFIEFTEQTGDFGTVYASFLMRATDITSIDTDTYRLVGFGKKNETNISAATQLYVRKDPTDSSKYNIGVNEDNGGSDIPTYVGGVTPTQFSENEDLFIVISFDDETGDEADGSTSSIWINPSTTGSQPAADAIDGIKGLDTDILVFTLGSTARTPEVIFDELRIASTWDEVTKVNHTWTGATADWNTNTNWDNNIVPSTLSNVIIPSGALNQPVIGATTGAIAHNLSVDNAANLSITSGGSLQSTGNVSGDLTYNLSIADDKWHLVSSPVIGEEYNDAWVTANGIASGATTASNRGIATYDNTTDDPTTSYWRYMQQGSNSVFQGKGYSLKSSASGTYLFTGTFPRANFEILISQSGGNNWNLVNNPYPSYLNIADFITANTSKLGGAFQAVYVWNPSNGANGAYESLTSGYIHPGQAFFVSANIASGTIDITENLQSAQTGVTFYKDVPNPYIKLSVSNGSLKSSTTFNLLTNATNGLNPGQDFGMFTGVKNNFAIYSHLVEDNIGIALKKQSLKISEMENLEIALGVIAQKNSEIKFTAESLNVPSGIDLFLEDKLTNSVTNLGDANSEYVIKLTDDLNGVGRFYLSTSAKSLSTGNVHLENISIYKTNNSNLKITGLSVGKASIKLYNILGKQIVNASFISNGVKDIALPNVATGIYIIELTTATGTLNKKITLE